MKKRFSIVASASCALLLSAGAKAAPAPLVTDRINESDRVTLAGNTRPEATLENDIGRVEDSLVMDGIQLVLQRSPEQDEAAARFVDEQQTEGSENYHRWLTAQEYGAMFGAAQEDIDVVTGWLTSHGFTVNGVQPGHLIIDFSGTAGQIREAFQTEIHRLDVNGVQHIANMSDPTIPAALAPVVGGFVSLHDFRPHPMFRPRADYTFTEHSTTLQAVTPPDLATIYNFNPLFSAGSAGKGQTIVVIEDTNIYSTSDWSTFRSTFGLSSYDGSLKSVNPSGSSTCTNPGVVGGADFEAAIDMEWATAAAPAATIEVASCADSRTTFGGLLALENLVNGSSPPTIVSISYGECEVFTGASGNTAYNKTYQQAASEGISVFVAAGDAGGASCDPDALNATHGLGVSGWASTPYNIAVGGTDFGDTYAKTTATYWDTTNSATYESAKSYVPEIPWSDSCASSLVASSEGYSASAGSAGFCSSAKAKSGDYLTTGAGGGGASSCATGKASASGVVGGTCKGHAKPSWQSIVGNPSDGVRDMPDVAFFAADGVWNHFLVGCFSDRSSGGGPCTGAPSGWAGGGGGTSFASPIMAGLQALVNEKWGTQGFPAKKLYSIAASEFGSSGNASCSATKGNAVGSTCIFHDVTEGSSDVNCTGAHDCYLPSGTHGVLSTSSSADDPAFNATTGWDFATGLGSINAANLVNSTAW